MLVVMQRGASKQEIEDVEREIGAMGYTPHPIYGVERTVIGAIGDERGKARLQALETSPGVERVIPILKPYKLAGLELRKEKTRAGCRQRCGLRRQTDSGHRRPVLCREPGADLRHGGSREGSAGAIVLRGGAYKPRTSPYSFQGLEEEGLKMLAEARTRTGLPIDTEVMKESVLELVAANMPTSSRSARATCRTTTCSRRSGRCDKPVLLKRGLASTISEWLMSAEYIMSQGNMQVILCERGIRTFETKTRNTLDLNAVAVLKRETHLPVVVDPSHGTGHWEYVEDMALAAIAAGADGLMIEVHPNPHEAWSDGGQSLTPERFAALMEKARKVAAAVEREI